MSASERIFDRGTRRGQRSLTLLGEDFRTARLTLGLSQQRVAEAARISRPVYGRVEHGSDPHLAVLNAARIAAVLGLDLSARVYPGGMPTRDAAHGTRLARLLANVGPPLRHRTDVPLPATTEHPERRAWDAVLWRHGERTAIELETRLYDVQAQVRRIHLKERDDPPDHLLLVVADTRTNRRVISEFADLLPDLSRLRTATVLKTLRGGGHPSTGFILL